MIFREIIVANTDGYGPERRIITACDVEGYSRRASDEQRDLQNRLAEIEERAARHAGLKRNQAEVQPAGDGDMIAWPPGTSELTLVVDYLRELRDEVVRVNRQLVAGSKIRLRLSVTTGLSEGAALGRSGQAVITAARLVDSAQAREALRLASDSPLVVILDDHVYKEVVDSELRGQQRADYVHVVVEDKHGKKYDAWLTALGGDTTRLASLGSSGTGPSAVAPGTPSEADDRGRGFFARMSTPVKAAIVTASGTVIAALIAAFALSGGHSPSSTGSATPPHTPLTQGLTSTASTSPAEDPTTPATAQANALFSETTDNHAGTRVYSDPEGDSVQSNGLIPFDTVVQVKCWAKNLSSMGSVNAFYLIETTPWTGDYAPAGTFANGDPIGKPGGTEIDPAVTQCAA